jgi:hypothetical protein
MPCVAGQHRCFGGFAEYFSSLDSRLRGNDGRKLNMRSFRSSLDSRMRGNDGLMDFLG